MKCYPIGDLDPCCSLGDSFASVKINSLKWGKIFKATKTLIKSDGKYGI